MNLFLFLHYKSEIRIFVTFSVFSQPHTFAFLSIHNPHIPHQVGGLEIESMLSILD